MMQGTAKQPETVRHREQFLVWLALLLASATAATSLGDPALAIVVANLSCGMVALAGGLALIFWRSAPPAAEGRHVRLLGIAALLWGIPQFMQAIATAVGPITFPTLHHYLPFLALPFAALAAIFSPRQEVGARPALRMVADSFFVGLAGALVVWMWCPVEMLDTLSQRGLVASLTGISAIAADITVATVAVLTAVRDTTGKIWITAIGAIVFTFGDAVVFPQVVVHGSPQQWYIGALWCLAWALIPIGVWRQVQAQRSYKRPWLGSADPDARATITATSIGLVMLMVGILSLLLRSYFPLLGERISFERSAIGMGFTVVALGVLFAREMLGNRLRIELLKRLHHEAVADPLTGLANRRVFSQRLSELPPGEQWCLLTLDVDGFKGINDLLGHASGDTFLCEVARRLHAVVPRAALVARFGGDEFAVLMPGTVAAAVGLGERLVHAVRSSAREVDGAQRLNMSASVGVAAVSGDADRSGTHDPLTALSASSAALRVAKSSGRDRVEVFDGKAAQLYHRRLSLEDRLRNAIAHGTINVGYQPIIDLRSKTMAGAECLARWSDSELGTVSPQEFIPLAEETGMVVALGEHILNQALSQAKEHDFPGRGLRLSCNVSPLQLRVPGFHRVVENALTANRFPAESLVIEVTESILVDENGPALGILRRLANSGVTIAIDDFGTGYSALGYLRRLPAQILKVDRSLSQSMVDQTEARAITQAVVDLGHGVGMSVVVEGVENRTVESIITQMNVNYGQGALYGPVVSAKRLFSEGAAEGGYTWSMPGTMATSRTLRTRRDAIL